nr:FecR domain-containing protein [Novosphingobium piscinae]
MLLLGTASALAAAPPPGAPAEAEVRYTIQPGDTLYQLGRAYLAGPRALVRVRRVNRIPANSLIVAGKDLRLPRSVLRDEPITARIDSFSGGVTLRNGAAVVPAKAGVDLGEGTVIETGPRGFVSLRLTDDSTITVPSQSVVRIVRLRRLLINQAVEREFATQSGRVRARVTPMGDPASSFRVTTPITVSAVRGTDFRVNYDAAAARALTEVEDGQVAFALGQNDAPAAARPDLARAETMLAPGFGALATPGKVGTATALLASPRLVDPDRAQTEPDLAFSVVPDDQAAGYRLQIGRDAGLLDLIDETSGSTPRFSLPGVPTGTYFVRIAALDAQGAEGRGRTYAFDRVLNAVAGSATAEGRRYRFKWTSAADGTPQFRFRLVRKDRPDLPIVDEALGTAREISVTALRPGEYSWRVLSLVPFRDRIVATWSAEQGFEVTAPR